MAVLKVLNRKGKYHDPNARQNVVQYIMNPLKTSSGFIGSIKVNEDGIGTMDDVAEQYKKRKGNGVQLRHTILSFEHDEVNLPEIADKIAYKIAMFVGKEYQIYYAVHENTDNLHIHFVQNHISYIDGHKYRGSREEYYDFINYVKKFLYRDYRIRLKTVSCLSDRDIQSLE